MSNSIQIKLGIFIIALGLTAVFSVAHAHTGVWTAGSLFSFIAGVIAVWGGFLIGVGEK